MRMEEKRCGEREGKCKALRCFSSPKRAQCLVQRARRLAGWKGQSREVERLAASGTRCVGHGQSLRGPQRLCWGAIGKFGVGPTRPGRVLTASLGLLHQ